MSENLNLCFHGSCEVDGIPGKLCGCHCHEIASLRARLAAAEAELIEAKKLLHPDVVRAAKALCENADKHPEGCCMECRKVAVRLAASEEREERLREAIATHKVEVEKAITLKEMKWPSDFDQALWTCLVAAGRA